MSRPRMSGEIRLNRMLPTVTVLRNMFNDCVQGGNGSSTPWCAVGRNPYDKAKKAEGIDLRIFGVGGQEGEECERSGYRW